MNTYIVIVTYNGMTWLKECLNSCSHYKVVVVDNGSTDNSVAFIKKEYQHVHLIEANQNLGFGRANNLGITFALKQNADSVLLLNQDAYLVDNVLEKLTTFQKANPEYGILSPIHINGDRDKLDFNFSNYVSSINNPYFYSDFVLHKTLKDVYSMPFVNAAAWLISKECLQNVGGFDPLFFHYGEDNNFCQRIFYHGYKLGVIPNAYIVHDREHRKSGMKAYTNSYFSWRSRYYKIKLANVNNSNPTKLFEIEVKELKKKLVKSIIKLNIKNLRGVFKELKILKNLKKDILHSYHTNKLKKPHYLDM